MKSLNTSNSSTGRILTTGFTLLEILIALSIFGLLFSLGSSLDFNAVRTGSFKTEWSRVLTLVKKARSLSLSNQHAVSHGFCVIGDEYVIFEGNDCLSSSPLSHEKIARPEGVVLSGIPAAGIVFEARSGDSLWQGRFSIESDTQKMFVTVNGRGLVGYEIP